jgi:hypothetical protein
MNENEMRLTCSTNGGNEKNSKKFLSGDIKGRGHVEDLGIEGRTRRGRHKNE